MEQTQRPYSRLLKWALILGIIIVLNLFFGYAISLVYPAPQYNAFCKDMQIVSPPTTKNECVSVGGQWTENTFPANSTVPTPAGTVGQTKPEVQGYCDQNYTCSKNYQTASDSYEKNVFVTLVILGIISILVAMFLKSVEAVSIALSFGGVLSLIIASIRYWSLAGNILKVVLLALALGALIWIGVKKFKDY